jgi:hypothetical protein
MNLKRVFTDDDTRPYAIHEIVFGHQTVGGPNQGLDDFECARANGHRDPARQQFAASEVDLPLPGLIDLALALLGHAGTPIQVFAVSPRL